TSRIRWYEPIVESRPFSVSTWQFVVPSGRSIRMKRRHKIKIMKISSHLCCLCLGLAAMLLTVAVQAGDHSRVYVVFKEGQKAAAKNLVLQATGQIHHEFDELRAIAATLPTPALEGLGRNPNIELIEEDPPR